jgi:hypothetical protein
MAFTVWVTHDPSMWLQITCNCCHVFDRSVLCGVKGSIPRLVVVITAFAPGDKRSATCGLGETFDHQPKIEGEDHNEMPRLPNHIAHHDRAFRD